jgi:hypothetical protein
MNDSVLVGFRCYPEFLKKIKYWCLENDTNINKATNRLWEMVLRGEIKLKDEIKRI